MTGLTQEDFKNTHFDFPELSRIVGEPNLGSLMTLRNQIKANAQTVESTLGGGLHGHLGLVLTPSVYNAMPDTAPYNRPALPILQISPTDTQFILAQARHQFSEDMREYREVNAVERSIIQQIVAAVEPLYIRALRDRSSNKIKKSIPTILKHLFDNYGDVTPKELQELSARVKNMTFDPVDPIDGVFIEIDDLENIAEMAENPYSEQQKIDMGFIILQNTRKFNSGLKAWDKKESDDKTWENFQAHFRKQQKELRRTGELSVSEALNKDDFVNLLSEGIREGVEHALSAREQPVVEASNEKEMEWMARFEQMNATITQLKNEKENLQNNTMMQQMPFMHPMMQQYQQPLPFQNSTNMYNNANNGNYGTGILTGGRKKRNPGKNFPFYNRYCWTCGGCDHWGRKCTIKKAGHQDGASFKNKNGGSVENCFTQN